MFYKIVLSAIMCHFCEKLMIAYAELVLKDTFAPRFPSIQAILDSVEFLENYEMILAKFSSMLSFSFFFVVFTFCKVTDSLMHEISLVHLCIKPRQTCQHLGAVSYRKLCKALKHSFYLPTSREYYNYRNYIP